MSSIHEILNNLTQLCDELKCMLEQVEVIEEEEEEEEEEQEVNTRDLADVVRFVAKDFKTKREFDIWCCPGMEKIYEDGEEPARVPRKRMYNAVKRIYVGDLRDYTDPNATIRAIYKHMDFWNN